MSDNARNTFNIQATNNLAANEILEEMTHMRTELRLVLKHVSGDAENVNAAIYFTKPSLILEEYYNEEEVYEVNNHTRGFRQNTRPSSRK